MHEDDDLASNPRRQIFEDKIAQNEVALEDMKANVQALENKRFELLEGLNSTSRIMTMLSTEILSDIFLAVCADDTSTFKVPRAFILGRVCRAWRLIAWSTPRLWSTIRICFSKKRYANQRVLLEEWIKRSGSCQLDLFLDTLHGDKGWKLPADSTLRFLMSTSHRWKRLNTIAFPVIAQILEETHPVFPVLDSLHLRNDFLVRGFFLSNWNFHSAAPRLRSLDVKDFIPSPQLGMRWETLVELQATLSFLYEDSIGILSSLPLLEKFHCILMGCNDHFNTSSVPIRSLPRLSSLFVDGHPKSIVTLLDIITTPSLQILELNIHPITRSQILWPNTVIALVERSSCHLTEMTLSQSNITEEGQILDFLGKVSPSLKNFCLYCPSTFTLSDRTVNRLNLRLPRNQRRRQQCLPNLENLVFRGDISFTLRTMLRMLRSRRRQRYDKSESEEEQTDSDDEGVEDRDGSSASEDEEAQSSNPTPLPGNPQIASSATEVTHSASRPDLSISITYLNPSWYHQKNPNKMWNFVKKTTQYATDGVSLYLEWEKPESDGEESE